MKEENKKNKKKILLTYLILAASLLVIAAITLTVIFTVNRNPSDVLIDAPQIQEPDDSGNTDNKEDDGNKKEDDVPTVNETGYKIPVSNARVSTAYEIAHNTTTNKIRVHQGLDFIATAGTEVYSIADGTVTNIVTGSKIGENYITVTHSDGMTSTYKYIDVAEDLEIGDSVKRGEVLGTIATANGYEIHEGDHLHFEINVKGKNVDPEIYLDLDVK